ncbi:single-stranded-DNA-specific exonuclease RecJ [Gloeocapsa sp. PCC 73106]|uniref:single-stranded-DNA-specific exonuclease RecJ n=1 Tax=Gloeocapsa sp. PCC 73106 TaxID=102232 RepID=UPI0002ACBB35|nr:single-stranded-DNA-specific exonuclease RecJ [Gloeocapsa sp. PCC 73106]ELR97087.1 single-stranded-DNA-specific exonuclease RecJ [Gloeocapsa sp. PCC 73106]
MSNSLPLARWRLANPVTAQVTLLSQSLGISPLLARVVLNRGVKTLSEAEFYLQPQSHSLPSPLVEFSDLDKSVGLLTDAIAQKQKIAICGDYDADGMTSTALLLRALRYLGADVDYAIPSRMTDGYGINLRIVEEFASEGVGLILTVDNGITAHEPVKRAKELGITVIITDHHDLPPTLPVADAILNPKLISTLSPYYGLAGVGVAYILAMTTAARFQVDPKLQPELLALYTLGTIADLAPLIGVNRGWLQQGLRLLPQSTITGIQALMQVAGISDAQKQLHPEDIGFKLGPRINAIGRLGDPQIVINLLTTTDDGLALELAMRCEQTNQRRQQMCQEIETEAIALIESQPIPWRDDRVLVIVAPDWHHGVIGIVASRLVERYGVPVFIGTYEEHNPALIRGSARSIEEFNVFEALEFAQDCLIKYGGHKAAGGFGLKSENLPAFKSKLRSFAHKLLEPQHLKPLVKIDGEANFNQLNFNLYQEIDRLHPWGIGNDIPVFWTPCVRVLEQQIIGGKHLKLTLAQKEQTIKAIAWRWAEYFPLPPYLDIAYKLRENDWQGNITIELELVSVRLPQQATKKAQFKYGDRSYWCSFWQEFNEIRIKNTTTGKILVVNPGETHAILGTSRQNAIGVDVTQSPYAQVIALAKQVLFDKE